MGGGVYDGEWDLGQRHGNGTTTYASGALHTGTWVQDERHGDGQATDVHGVVTRGIWEHDVLKALRCEDGSAFRGTWLDGKPAHGIQTHTNGSIYEGSYEDSEPWEGQMTNFLGADGGRYTGQVFDGFRNKCGVC